MKRLAAILVTLLIGELLSVAVQTRHPSNLRAIGYASYVYIQFMEVDGTTGKAVTGDSANIVLRWNLDGYVRTPSNSVTEPDSTNSPGVYQIVIKNTESTNATNLALGGVGTLSGYSKSSANYTVIPKSITFEMGTGDSYAKLTDGTDGLAKLFHTSGYTAPDNTRPANFTDLNITKTTGLVRPDMSNASGNYAGNLTGTLSTLATNGLKVRCSTD